MRVRIRRRSIRAWFRRGPVADAAAQSRTTPRPRRPAEQQVLELASSTVACLHACRARWRRCQMSCVRSMIFRRPLFDLAELAGVSSLSKITMLALVSEPKARASHLAAPRKVEGSGFAAPAAHAASTSAPAASADRDSSSERSGVRRRARPATRPTARPVPGGYSRASHAGWRPWDGAAARTSRGVVHDVDDGGGGPPRRDLCR